MFENLSDRLSRVVKNIKGEARITEANTQEMLREVRLALLEADVALPVVKEFIKEVKEDALGEEVLTSLMPGQALVGIVNRRFLPAAPAARRRPRARGARRSRPAPAR